MNGNIFPDWIDYPMKLVLALFYTKVKSNPFCIFYRKVSQSNQMAMWDHFQKWYWIFIGVVYQNSILDQFICQTGEC